MSFVTAGRSIDARMATTANVHVARGGPEDACGDGYIDVSTKGHMSSIMLYGESFAQGDADASAARVGGRLYKGRIPLLEDPTSTFTEDLRREVASGCTS